MSAPVSHDPLVVNTSDGAVWMRRAVTRDGQGLYAVADAPACCPPFVMATLAELAEHGIAGSADCLPVPVGPERPESVTPAWLMEIAARAEAATPGPWVEYPKYGPHFYAYVEGLHLRGVGTLNFGDGPDAKADREFVLHARQDVPALLARVAELEAQREALTERLRAGQHWQRGRNPELVSENYVSQSELREIFGIPLVAPWDEDPCRPCGCPKRFDRHADGCPTLPAEAGEGQ
ncbi:hypothetical protein [Streptomyces longwoodensis]|uniref:hypothetical protein n=1 Tax=Streptomyces longwoodensis TaxID=68231 RepID=UPI0036EA70C8